MRRMFFFFNDTATTEIYTLSLHDALPICAEDPGSGHAGVHGAARPLRGPRPTAHGTVRDGLATPGDRKSTRLNSSHANISYAVFCLKKKKKPLKQFMSTHTVQTSADFVTQ